MAKDTSYEGGGSAQRDVERLERLLADARQELRADFKTHKSELDSHIATLTADFHSLSGAQAEVDGALGRVGDALSSLSASVIENKRGYERTAAEFRRDSDQKAAALYAAIKDAETRLEGRIQVADARQEAEFLRLMDDRTKLAVNELKNDLTSVRTDSVETAIQRHKDACDELKATQSVGCEQRLKSLEDGVKANTGALAKLSIRVAEIAVLSAIGGSALVFLIQLIVGKYFPGASP